MEPKLDPTTKDLLLMNKQLVEDPTMSTAVLLRVNTRRGSVPGLPWFGEGFPKRRRRPYFRFRLSHGPSERVEKCVSAFREGGRRIREWV